MERIILVVYAANIVLKGDDKRRIYDMKLFLQNFKQKIQEIWSILFRIQIARFP